MPSSNGNGNPVEALLPPRPSVDEEAEAWLVSSLYQDPDAFSLLGEACEELFWFTRHKLIFQAMRAIRLRQEDVNPLSLRDEMERAGTLDKLGTRDSVVTMLGVLDCAPSPSIAGWCVKRLRQAGARRALVSAAHEIASAVESVVTPVSEILADARRVMGNIDLGDPSSEEPSDMPSLLASAVEDMTRIREHGGISGLALGLSDLDHLLGGLRPGTVCIVAARPSIGKTSLAMRVLDSVSVDRGIPSQVFSLEVPPRQLVLNIAFARARVSGYLVYSGRASEEDYQRIKLAFESMREAPMRVDGTVHLSPSILRAQVEKARRTQDVKLVIVDYLQLMKSDISNPSRQQEVAAISRAMKLIALEFQVVVMALAQLNRNPELRTDGLPRLADLRDSGAIEQDADVVLLLHRPEMQDKDERPGEADVLVAKNRYGPTGHVALAFNRNFMRFDNLARGHEK